MVFFSGTGEMIGPKHHHITPFTRYTRFKRLLLTLAIIGALTLYYVKYKASYHHIKDFGLISTTSELV